MGEKVCQDIGVGFTSETRKFLQVKAKVEQPVKAKSKTRKKSFEHTTEAASEKY